jgi:hypothetical protein
MYREQYSAEEWATLEFAPLWMFTGVAGIDENVDDQEVGTLAKELAEWALYKEPMVQEVMLSVGQNLPEVMTRYHGDSRNVLVGLKDVSALLDRKATADQAKNFRGAMMLLGRNIAEASGSGIAGTESNASIEEKAAMLALGQALGAF